MAQPPDPPRRPSSLVIDHPQDIDLVLDDSSPPSIDSGDSLPADTPCFLHSNLNKDASLTDWLKTRGGPAQSLIGDLGVAKSLQHPQHSQHSQHPQHPQHSQHSQHSHHPHHSHHSHHPHHQHPHKPLLAHLRHHLSPDSDEEDDEFVGSLTKQLAETAVGVREMSKQLGRARVQSNIQNILIVTKARDNRLIKLTRQLALYLMLKRRPGMKRGLTVYVDSQLRRSKRFDAAGLQREHPDLFVPFPRRSASSHSSAASSNGESGTEDASHEDEGQLRYWTSSMCNRSPHLFDFVVTLGGDGTVLFTSWLFQRIVPPVLPFALGSLGFLTNFDFSDHEVVMDSAIDCGIRVNLRMRFTCTVYRAVNHGIATERKAVKRTETGEILMKSLEQNGWEAVEGAWSVGHAAVDGKPQKDKAIKCFTTRPAEQFEVLNDLVVDRGPSPYVSLLELFGDDHHMTTVQADGLTVSTPTGSTAYSLSAGGSLAHPEIPAILITPICPHTLSFRPMLLPDSMELRISVPYNSRSTAWASFDGRGRVELKQGDHIKVTASKYPFPTVCANNQSTDWFQAISRTLKWNERERQKSFVVVEEEEPTNHDKRRKRAPAEEGGPEKVVHDQRNENPNEDVEDELSEEEDQFDIDDSSVETTDAAVTHALDMLTPQEHANAADKVRESRQQKHVMTSIKEEHGRPTNSRSRSRTAGNRQPSHQSHNSRHVDFDLSAQNDADQDSLHAAHQTSRDDISSARSPSGRSYMPNRDSEDIARTPTATTLLHSRVRDHSRSRSRDLVGPRTFAVWGNDESDTSDSDAF